MRNPNSDVSFDELGDPKFIQEKLGYAILTDYKFSMQMVEILDVNYFNLPYVRIIVKEYINYYLKYKLFPSYDMLKELVYGSEEVTGDIGVKDLIEKYFDNLLKYLYDVDPDMPLIKEQVHDFCKKQKIYKAMFEASEKLDRVLPRAGSAENSKAFDEIQQLMSTALVIGGEKDVGLIYSEDIESRIRELVNREPVSTGYPSLDKIIRGGFGKGELIVGIGATGSGKSTLLINFAINALRAGKKVVYYSFELASSIIALRCDANVMGIPLEDFVTTTINPVTGEAKLSIKDSMRGKLADIKSQYMQPTSELVIKQFPSRQANAGNIRSHLFSLAMQNLKPDLILVDYVDIMKPTIYKKEKRFELEEMYGELRAIAVENQCPAITVSQTNRQGWDNSAVSLKEISEAYGKANEVDLALALSRSTKDKEKNICRIAVCKNRNGKEGLIIPCKYYDSLYKIEMFDACYQDGIPTEFISDEKEAMKNILNKYSGNKQD